MKVLLSLFCYLFLFSGCNIIQSISNEDKANIIRIVAKNGTYLSLMTIYDNDEINKRLFIAELLKRDISNNVIAILDNESIELSKKTLDNLMERIPGKIAPYLKTAIELLSIKRIDISDEIGTTPTQLVKGFFTGIIEGCDMVIEEENNVMGTNSTITSQK